MHCAYTRQTWITWIKLPCQNNLHISAMFLTSMQLATTCHFSFSFLYRFYCHWAYAVVGFAVALVVVLILSIQFSNNEQQLIVFLWREKRIDWSKLCKDFKLSDVLSRAAMHSFNKRNKNWPSDYEDSNTEKKCSFHKHHKNLNSV